jgi:hypothetical protein
MVGGHELNPAVPTGGKNCRVQFTVGVRRYTSRTLIPWWWP